MATRLEGICTHMKLFAIKAAEDCFYWWKRNHQIWQLWGVENGASLHKEQKGALYKTLALSEASPWRMSKSDSSLSSLSKYDTFNWAKFAWAGASTKAECGSVLATRLEIRYSFMGKMSESDFSNVVIAAGNVF